MDKKRIVDILNNQGGIYAVESNTLDYNIDDLVYLNIFGYSKIYARCIKMVKYECSDNNIYQFRFKILANIKVFNNCQETCYTIV